MIIIILKAGFYGKSKNIKLLEENKVEISVGSEVLEENVDYILEDDKKRAITLKYGVEINSYQITIMPLD